MWSLVKYSRNWHIYEHFYRWSFKINRKLNCDDDCLIYLLTCNYFGKQYVRKTTDEFRHRWTNYKSNDRKNARNEACTQEHLFEHFKSEGHIAFLGNVSITLIDKTDGKDPKRRENYWMRTLKTYAPFGLNIEDSVWPIPCRSKMFLMGLPAWNFIGILIIPGTDLRQDFSDMAFICLNFFYIACFLITNLLFYVTNLYVMCCFYIIC